MNQTTNPVNSLPYHLRGAFRGYETALGRYLKSYGLPISHFYILQLEWDSEGNAQKDIAQRAFMTESVASQVIKKMEDRGLVRRKPNPEDSRAHLVSLTASGGNFREAIVKKGIQISTDHALDISREDMKTAIQVLNKVREGFELYNKPQLK